jgi:predicted transcriptional regulator
VSCGLLVAVEELHVVHGRTETSTLHLPSWRRRHRVAVVELSRTPAVMVSCRLCGRKAHNLGRHLRSRHDMTSSEYRARFPGASVTSAQYRRRVARPAASFKIKAEGKMPTIRCAVCGGAYQSLGPHVKTHGMSGPEYAARYGGPLVSPYLRESHREWTRDLNEGIVWDPPAIIRAIRRWAGKRAGQPPTFRAWERSRNLTARRFSSVGADHPTAARVQQVFGSWNAAIRAAGYEPRGRGGSTALKRCRRGHPLTPDNVRVSATGVRRCLTCDRTYKREWARRARAEARQHQ